MGVDLLLSPLSQNVLHQIETLLQPHQARRHVDTSGKPGGGGCLKVGSKKIDINFDGWKCYFKIQKPKEADLSKY